MRMCIRLGDPAVRGPTRVRDAGPAGERLGGQLAFERRDLADGAAEAELAILLDDGDAGRVIAAILEPFEALDEHRHDVSLSDRPDDSAHILVVPFFTSLESA